MSDGDQGSKWKRGHWPARLAGGSDEPVAWLRDLDGTGSYHPAAEGDPGAFPVYDAEHFAPFVTRNTGHDETPIPMVLHCPRCGVQHIDEATEDWPNPPHRSHACQAKGCGCIWRPADVATAGVAAISTRGKSDNWAPGDTTLRDRWGSDGRSSTAVAIRGRLPDGAGARGLG